jgi:hypothetical protein
MMTPILGANMTCPCTDMFAMKERTLGENSWDVDAR